MDPHKRPSFGVILEELEKIAALPICQEKFYSMQETWKLEIGDMLREIQMKEQVKC